MSSLPGTAWHVSFVASCCLHRSFARIILYYFLKKERIILYYPSAPARDLDRRQRSDVKSGSFESWWVPQWPRRQVGQAPWFLSTCSALLFTVRRPHQRNAKMLSKILSSIYSSVRSKMPLPLQLCRVNPDGPGGISIFTLQRRENIFFLNYADFFFLNDSFEHRIESHQIIWNPYGTHVSIVVSEENSKMFKILKASLWVTLFKFSFIFYVASKHSAWKIKF
jgi:hypothetical protein